MSFSNLLESVRRKTISGTALLLKGLWKVIDRHLMVPRLRQAIRASVVLGNEGFVGSCLSWVRLPPPFPDIHLLQLLVKVIKIEAIHSKTFVGCHFRKD
jgi:hypothetical protein